MERTIYARQPDLMRTAHKAACTAEDGRRSEKTARQRRGDGGEAAGKPGRRSQYCGALDALLTQPPPEGADRGAMPGAAMQKGAGCLRRRQKKAMRQRKRPHGK